jgi:hemerythrin-like domain-containing protein
MKITAILSAEHAVFHNLFDHIENAAPRLATLGEVKSIAALLETLLRAHSKTEDELLIEPLEHCFEQIGHRETFHDEHDDIDQQLSDVQRVKTLKAAKKLLLAAVEKARHHFDKEERIVFPMAERVLKAKTLLSLGAEWAKRREAGLEFTPEFESAIQKSEQEMARGLRPRVRKP